MAIILGDPDVRPEAIPSGPDIDEERRDAILRLVAQNQITRAQAAELLQTMGISDTEASRLLTIAQSGVDPDTGQPAQITPAPEAGPGAAAGVPIAEPAPAAPITGAQAAIPEMDPVARAGDIFDPASIRAIGDIAGSFAGRSGVAPGFRNFVQSRAQDLATPFGMDVLTGGIPGFTREDILPGNAPAAFERFLGGGAALPDVGQSLRSAGAFLRTPGAAGSDIAASQKALFNALTNEGAAGTSGFFDPTIDLVTQRTQGRGLGGFDFPSAIRTTLQQRMQDQENQFGGRPEEFIDFLAQQGFLGR